MNNLGLRTKSIPETIDGHAVKWLVEPTDLPLKTGFGPNLSISLFSMVLSVWLEDCPLSVENCSELCFMFVNVVAVGDLSTTGKMRKKCYGYKKHSRK